MSTNQSLSLLQEMAVFVRVVDTGSFSEAARQLGQTPSAVSRAVSRLERALALKLLQRTTRKLGLSEAGQRIYIHCTEMLNAADAVIESSGHLSDEPHGVIRLSVPKAIGHYMIHPHMPEFFERYPKVSVHLLLEDRYIDFIDDAVDAAIRITNAPTGTLMGKRLTMIPHVLVATSHYLNTYGEPIEPSDLKHHQCICLGEQPSDAKWKFIQGQKTTTISVQGRYYANHTGIRLSAALQHMGVASLPYFVAHHAIEQGDLIQVLPEWIFDTYYSGEAWLLYPPTKYLPSKMKVLIQFLLEKLTHTPTLLLPDRSL